MYEKIRKIRNEMLYNGKPPLEVGCKIKVNPTCILEIEKNEKWIKEEKQEQKRLSKIFKHQSDNWHYLQGNSSHVEAFDKILGKPVSLNDILRMLQKDIETEYKGVSYFIESNGELVKRLDGTYTEAGYTEETIAYIDLTKEIKDQNKEVLEKLYNLIK